jgi:hypothetical protein
VTSLPSGRVDGVLVDPSVAAEVAGLVHRAMSEAVRRDGVRFSTGAWTVVDELRVLASEWRQRVVATTGRSTTSGKVEDVGDPQNLSGEVGTAAAAALLGVRSRQAVVNRICRGTLPARKDQKGHYRIRRENLPRRTSRNV